MCLHGHATLYFGPFVIVEICVFADTSKTYPEHPENAIQLANLALKQSRTQIIVIVIGAVIVVLLAALFVVVFVLNRKRMQPVERQNEGTGTDKRCA